LLTAGLSAVANLQRDRHRLSAERAVDESVNNRWKDVGYALNARAETCFCYRFDGLILCIKNRLPFSDLPTMLGVQQALEHKI
jgi:hypothetical protein